MTPAQIMFAGYLGLDQMACNSGSGMLKREETEKQSTCRARDIDEYRALRSGRRERKSKMDEFIRARREEQRSILEQIHVEIERDLSFEERP